METFGQLCLLSQLIFTLVSSLTHVVLHQAKITADDLQVLATTAGHSSIVTCLAEISTHMPSNWSRDVAAILRGDVCEIIGIISNGPGHRRQQIQVWRAVYHRGNSSNVRNTSRQQQQQQQQVNNTTSDMNTTSGRWNLSAAGELLFHIIFFLNHCNTKFNI